MICSPYIRAIHDKHSSTSVALISPIIARPVSESGKSEKIILSVFVKINTIVTFALRHDFGDIRV